MHIIIFYRDVEEKSVCLCDHYCLVSINTHEGIRIILKNRNIERLTLRILKNYETEC
jgi:hypothetical protein